MEHKKFWEPNFSAGRRVPEKKVCDSIPNLFARFSPKRLMVGCMLLVVFSTTPAAQTSSPPVVVGSYQGLRAAMDMFAEQRSLAPEAEPGLFVLRVNAGATNLNPANLRLQLQDSHFALDIPLGADGSFSLPRAAQTFGTDAQLLLSGQREPGNLAISPQVISPGLPTNARRLGDLRLECKAGVALKKAQLGLLGSWTLSALAGGDWCFSSKLKQTFYATAALRGVELRAGARHVRFTHGLSSQSGFDGNAYRVPLADEQWPDDTLVLLEFVTSIADDQAGSTGTQPESRSANQRDGSERK